MDRAVHEYGSGFRKEGGTTITRAALEHGVLRTTLQDRVLNGCRPGH